MLPLARLVGEKGCIVAFEPNPATAAILERHLRMNGLSRVLVEDRAVGATTGSVRLFDTTPGSGLSRIAFPHPVHVGRRVPNWTDVPLVSIDDYCAANRIDPDWLVVDVEGHEIEVLRGAAATFARRPGLRAVVEVHPNTWPSVELGRSALAKVIDGLGLQARGLTSQCDALAEYGHVLLEPPPSH